MSRRRLPSVAEGAIRRPVTTLMAFLALGLLGFLSYRELPIQLFPNFSLPTVFVSVQYPGASAEAVEEDCLRVLEGELATLGGIEEISSTASTGSGFVTLAFERDVDLDHASLRVEQRLAAAKPRLPLQTFVGMQRFDTSSFSNVLMRVSFRGDMDLEAMRRMADDTVVPALQGVDGVVRVDVLGGASKQIGVFYEPDRAQARGVSAGQVRAAMAEATSPVVHVGQVDDGGRRLPVSLDGRAQELSDVANAPVGAGGKVKLRHVARIEPGIAGLVERYRVDGQTSVGLSVYKDQRSNLVRVARRLRDRVEAFNAEHEGAGLSLSVDLDTAEVIEESLETLIQRASSGALLAIVVLLVFLPGVPPSVVTFLGVVVGVLTWEEQIPLALVIVLVVLFFQPKARPVLVVMLAAPTSLLIACWFFKLADMSLNVLTLLGLALSVGMLLDNAIVVLESIAARRQAGDGVLEAARRGSSRVQRSVMAGTVTTLVVFIPLYIIDTEATPLLRDLALAVSFPLLASLLVAITLVPVASAWFGVSAPEAEPAQALMPTRRPAAARLAYSVLIRFALRCQAVTLGGFFLLVLLTVIAGLPLVGVFAEGQRPADDRVELVAEFPAGTPIEDVEATTEALERLVVSLFEVGEDRDDEQPLAKRVKDAEALKEIQASIRKEETSVTLVLPEADERTVPVSLDRVRKDLREKVASVTSAEVSVDPLPEAGPGGGGGGAAPAAGFGGATVETVRVMGPGGPELAALSVRVKERLQQIQGLTRVRSDLSTSQPSLEIHADRERLAEFGLTTTELMNVVWATRREGESSRYPFRLDQEDVDLVLWVEGGNDRTVEDVRRFPLTTRTGARIPMTAVARVTTGNEDPQLRRWQRQRTITLTYGFDESAMTSGEATAEVRAEVDAAMAAMMLPEGAYIDVEHADEELSVGWQMAGLALALVVIVLAMAFESVVQPFLIVLCVPLAAVGVIWSLVLTGTGVNQLVVLAIVVLLGVTVNNGILFVDRSQSLLAAGSRRAEAVMRAAHERMRPVLMTAATTVMGMLPLAIDTGGEQEIWPPFARAVIGGLGASTLISLVLIPAGILVFGRMEDLMTTLGVKLSLLSLVMSGGLLYWAYWEAELVVGSFMRILLVIPALLLVFLFVRLLQKVMRGESPPDLVGDGPIELRSRKARKVYGGLPRFAKEYLLGKRWEARAAGKGLGPTEIATPAGGRKTLSWQVILLMLFVYLHALATTTWGLLLLAIPTLMLVDGAIASACQAVGRPLAWPLEGWRFRLWRVGQATACLTYLWFTRRPAEASDVVTFVFACMFVGVWGLFHLIKEGGLFGIISRFVAPQEIHALRGVSLEFGNGLHGLLGPNGAGKSTFMRLVVNLYESTRGQIHINGHELRANAASFQPRIGYLPQDFGVPPNVTAREYLQHQALLVGKQDPKERERVVEEALAEVSLTERADEDLGGYSGGMRQRVGIARTLLNVPKIVVVDEPTVGLDPKERIRFRNLLAELAKTRIVLLSTHVVEDIGSSCKEVVVLDKGVVVFRGAPREMVARADGRAFIMDVPEADIDVVSKTHRVVQSTRLPGGLVRVRCVGDPPEGAEVVQATLEDAYLLMLGEGAETSDVAA